MTKRIAAVLALVAAVLVAISTTLAGFEWGPSEGGTTTIDVVATVAEVPIPGPTPDVVIDDDQEVTPAQKAGEDELAEGPAIHEDAKDETPPGVSEADVEEIEESRPEDLGPPLPVGGAQLLSCTSNPVRNFSTRAAGSVVSMPTLHYTVSTPGTLDAIRGLFDDPNFAASSHTLLEPSGRCVQIVPFSKKAWTQGAFNSVADSVEIICCRTDPSRAWWLAQPIIAKSLLASWIVDRLRARGLPPKLVDPIGCEPLAGWTDHARLECGNSHTDVGKAFPFDVVSKQVRTLYFAGQTLNVWRVMSGGKVLHEEKAKTTPRGTGYARTLAWMRGPGATKVRASEKAHGSVNVRLVAVPRT